MFITCTYIVYSARC